MKRGFFLLLTVALLLTSGCAGYSPKRSLLNYDYPAYSSPYTPPMIHPLYYDWRYSPYLSPYHPFLYP